MAEADIGCSLAEAAEAPAYTDYLAAAAAEAAPALHVVYINTSLRTKALAHAQVPTITCTSSNVLATVLQVCLACLCLHLCGCCSCLPAGVSLCCVRIRLPRSQGLQSFVQFLSHPGQSCKDCNPLCNS